MLSRQAKWQSNIYSCVSSTWKAAVTTTGIAPTYLLVQFCFGWTSTDIPQDMISSRDHNSKCDIQYCVACATGHIPHETWAVLLEIELSGSKEHHLWICNCHSIWNQFAYRVRHCDTVRLIWLVESIWHCHHFAKLSSITKSLRLQTCI